VRKQSRPVALRKTANFAAELTGKAQIMLKTFF
jgi:hypothetical protein